MTVLRPQSFTASSSEADHPPDWPRVWRGESSGTMFDTFDSSKTNEGSGFFFAQERANAQWYAAQGTEPRCFILDPGRVLDLRDPTDAYIGDPMVRKLIDDLHEQFDEWVDRISGEPGHANDWLEAGNLYDYEGNGRGQRWNTLFRLAWAHGFDSVVLHDATDGNSGELATTWVARNSSQIHFLPSPSNRPGAFMSTTQDCKDLLNSQPSTSTHGASGWKRLWKTTEPTQIQRVFSNSIDTFFVQITETESGLSITAMGNSLDAVPSANHTSPASTVSKPPRP